MSSIEVSIYCEGIGYVDGFTVSHGSSLTEVRAAFTPSWDFRFVDERTGTLFSHKQEQLVVIEDAFACIRVRRVHAPRRHCTVQVILRRARGDIDLGPVECLPSTIKASALSHA